MHYLWGMMNTLQLISFMLKFNLTVPPNAFLFFQLINDFLSMKAQFIDNWIETVTEKVLGVTDEVSEKVKGKTDEEPNVLKNLGTFFFGIIALILGVLLIGLLIFLAKKSTLCQKLLNILKEKLFFNSVLRLAI